MTKSNLEGNCLPSPYSSGGDYSPLWWGRHSISSEGWQSVVVGQTRSLEWGMAVHCGGRGMVAGVWGLKGCQETERAYSSTYRKPKERTGSRTMLGNLKPYHQWHTASNKTSIPKDFRTLWNGTIYCIWTHEPVGNIYHSNYKDLGQTMLNGQHSIQLLFIHYGPVLTCTPKASLNAWGMVVLNADSHAIRQWVYYSGPKRVRWVEYLCHFFLYPFISII